MGTTKLTRKEILAEDPVFDAIVTSIDRVRTHAKTIGLAAAAVALAALGIYFGLEYLETRDLEAQRMLSKAVDFYHAGVDASAVDDPYGKGAEPLFRSDELKYQAAARELNSIIEKHPSSKVAVIARYYLGLSQLRLGQTAESIKSLETVRDNNKDRTLSYLAKKVLAKTYIETGNPKAAQETLEGMIQDPQCELPKDELRLQLARALSAQNKRDEALKTLREAQTESGRSMLQGWISQELQKLETVPAAPPPQTITIPASPK